MGRRAGPGAWLRNSLLAGLVFIFPAFVTGAVLWWIFKKVVSPLTESAVKPLFFFILKPIAVPARIAGHPVLWNAVSLILLILVVLLLGVFARNFIGRRVIRLAESGLTKIPIIRSVYVTLQEFSHAFLGQDKTAFSRVVLVEYPRTGLYTIGLVAGRGPAEIDRKTGERHLAVFIATTPNPTSGFLVMVPEKGLIPLDMSVAHAFKVIISGGSVGTGVHQPEGKPGLTGPDVPGAGAGATTQP